MVENKSASSIFPRGPGGDVEMFKTKYTGGCLNEKINFQIVTPRAPRYLKMFKQNFCG